MVHLIGRGFVAIGFDANLGWLAHTGFVGAWRPIGQTCTEIGCAFRDRRYITAHKELVDRKVDHREFTVETHAGRTIIKNAQKIGSGQGDGGNSPAFNTSGNTAACCRAGASGGVPYNDGVDPACFELVDGLFRIHQGVAHREFRFC